MGFASPTGAAVDAARLVAGLSSLSSCGNGYGDLAERHATGCQFNHTSKSCRLRPVAAVHSGER